MNLYHVSQSENGGYDTFSDFVICAPDAETARLTNPATGCIIDDDEWEVWEHCWCKSPEFVKVEHIGIANENIKEGIICSSFHAG